MNNLIALKVQIPNLNPYSKRQMNADVYCSCCGRGLPNRNTAWAVKMSAKNGKGDVVVAETPEDWKGRDPVEWAAFVGSHCAKQLPKTHKLSMARAIKYAGSWA